MDRRFHIRKYYGSGTQHGDGLGNILGGIAKFAIPYIRKGLQFITPHAAKLGSEILGDVASGQNLRKSAQRRTKAGLNRMATGLFQSGSGGGLRIAASPSPKSRRTRRRPRRTPQRRKRTRTNSKRRRMPRKRTVRKRRRTRGKRVYQRRRKAPNPNDIFE